MNFGIRFPFVVLSLGGLLALTAQPLRAAPNTYNHNVNNWNISNDVFSRPLSAPFASWARDREAHVTINDVSRLVRDSTVTNTAAAALAAVHLYQLNHKNQVNAINRGLVEELAKSRTTTNTRSSVSTRARRKSTCGIPGATTFRPRAVPVWRTVTPPRTASSPCR
jgi:hypothetical protein